MTEELNKIVKGAGIILIGLIISKIAGYIYRIIISKTGVEEYGLISLALAIIFGITVIVRFGLDKGVLRYTSIYKSKNEYGKIKYLLNTAIKLILIFSVIGIFLVFLTKNYLWILFKNERLPLLISILIFAVPFDAIKSIYANTIKGLGQVKYLVYSENIGENIIKILGTIILLYFGLGLIGASVAYVLSMIFSFIVLLYFTNKLLKKYKIEKENKLMDKIIKYSWPLVLTDIILIFTLWTDTLMLGFFKTTREVGLYNAAGPTALISYIFPLAIITLFLPVWATSYVKNNKDDMKKIYQAITKWIFLINLFVLTIFLLFSKEIITMIFGKEYYASYLAFAILSIGYFITYLSLTSRDILMVLKKTKLIFINTLLIGLSNVILNFILIPKYGIVGAAFATAISFLIGSILMITEAIYIIKIFPFNKHFIKIILINILIFIIIKEIPLNFNNYYIFSLTCIILSILYLILLFITKSFENSDLDLINTIEKKLNIKLLRKILDRLER
ncbi:flippase [Candidatus Woesearchaeota archaeon]|nr:flippase [Candidatus Woesearchaeota archaeon]